MLTYYSWCMQLFISYMAEFTFQASTVLNFIHLKWIYVFTDWIRLCFGFVEENLTEIQWHLTDINTKTLKPKLRSDWKTFYWFFYCFYVDKMTPKKHEKDQNLVHSCEHEYRKGSKKEKLRENHLEMCSKSNVWYRLQNPRCCHAVMSSMKSSHAVLVIKFTALVNFGLHSLFFPFTASLYLRPFPRLPGKKTRWLKG